MEPATPHPRPFGYLAWSGAIGLVLILGITLAAVYVRSLDSLCMEYGPMANMSIAVWMLSAFAAAAAYRRWTGRMDRIMAFWVAFVSCLAALHQADAHILLEASVIGRFGIHYRLDWLFDPQTHILLKLGYGVLFVLLVGAVFGPLMLLRSRFWRLTRAGDAGIGMLLVAAIGLALGYAMGDVIRGAGGPLGGATRQLTARSGEFLAGLAFLAGSLLLWKSPFSERLKIPGK